MLLLFTSSYLNREYGHVWHFLRTFNLSYCSLYDQGYTSLGKKSQTFPNPALLRKTPIVAIDNSVTGESDSRSTATEYWPAYMLSDWTLERAGRANSVSLKPASSKSEDETTRAEERTKNSGKVSSEGETLISNDECPTNLDTTFAQPSVSSSESSQTAALLIIGDEILNGFTTESNLQVTSKALASIGIPLRKVSIVSDDIDDIAQEVQRLSQRYDIVFTSGGIGPTHDDVTLKAIAKALQQDIRINAEMLQHLETVHIEQQQRQKVFVSSSDLQQEQEERPMPPMEESMRRLAFLPEQSQLRFPPPPDDYYSTVINQSTTTVSSTASAATVVESASTAAVRNKTWPILQCDNIFILPGVPQFYASKMQLITKYFLSKQEILERWKIILDLEEKNLVSHLDAVVARHARVKIGSYPYVEHPEFKTIITVEAAHLSQVEAAVQELVEALPRHVVLRVERVATSSTAPIASSDSTK